jgi:hypothetical protein
MATGSPEVMAPPYAGIKQPAHLAHPAQVIEI